MKNSNLFSKTFLINIFLFSMPLLAYEYQEPVCSKTKYYSIHAATGFVAQIMCYTMLYYNCRAMQYFEMDKKVPHEILLLCGILPGAYLVYKAPQWTDEYILRLNRKRSTKNKLKNFFLRWLPAPYSILLAEWASDGATFIKD